MFSFPPQVVDALTRIWDSTTGFNEYSNGKVTSGENPFNGGTLLIVRILLQKFMYMFLLCIRGYFELAQNHDEALEDQDSIRNNKKALDSLNATPNLGPNIYERGIMLTN